jgi:hypothetical protein
MQSGLRRRDIFSNSLIRRKKWLEEEGVKRSMTVEARNQETPVPHAAQEDAERQFRSSWDFEGVKKAAMQGPKLIAINQHNKRIILLRCVKERSCTITRANLTRQ